MVQKGSCPEDITTNSLFQARWAEVIKTRGDELVTQKIDNTTIDTTNEADAASAARVETSGLRGTKSIDRCAPDTSDYWDSFAAQLVRQYIKLAVEPRSSSGIANEVKNSALNGEFVGETNKSTIVITLDPELLSEAANRPADRRPPPDQSLVSKLLHGVLSARGGATNEDGQRHAPCDNDVLFLCDGGRDSFKTCLPVPYLIWSWQPASTSMPVFINYVSCSMRLPLRLAQFQDLRKNMTAACHKEILIGFNEDSVRARKLRIRSATPMKTTSRMHVITNNTVEKTVPDKKYEDFHGSTRNDMLSLVSLPAYDLMWNLTIKDKSLVYAHSDGNRLIASSEARAYLMFDNDVNLHNLV